MTTPRTKAGRDLHEHWPHHVWCASHAGDPCDCKGNLLGGILAIEAEALPSVEELARALHEANIDCDYSRRFDKKSCQPGDGPHVVMTKAILAALRDERDP